MKVLIDPQIFSAQKYGGISRYFCELVRCISGVEGVSIGIVAPFYINAYIARINRLNLIGFRSPSRIEKFRSRFFKFIIRFFGLLVGDIFLRFHSPDIIHESYYLPFGLGSKKTKRVLTIYDMIHEKFPNQFSTSDKIRSYKAVAAKRADHIICISESTRKDVIEILNIEPSKISVVHLGFNPPQLTYVNNGFNFNNIRKPFLLFVGNRSGYKNFIGLLNAFAKSNLLKSQYQLVCFGGPPFDDEESLIMNVLGLKVGRQVLHFSGDDDLLFEFYRRAKAFIYPSLYEGFGIPPLEAMACGCPVICSNTSSIPEVVGNAGKFFNPYDITAMSLAIENIVSSSFRMDCLRELGRERLLKFSWERCALETAKIYKNLLS
jgi:glycosyltransferase involved in cell wall biosynthesis